MSKQAKQLLLRSEPSPKRQTTKGHKEQAGDQERRAIYWLITLLVCALIITAGLGLLRSLIAIITLD
jgi:hypothetical protein